MPTYISAEYNCAICGGRDMERMRVSAHDGRTEHADVLDCVRVLAYKLGRAQEDIRALEYRMNTAGVARP